jgi:Niemann-Pick C1 protein
LNVTETQETTTGQIAVKSVDFFVGQKFGEGFYDSCKNVQVSAANTYAMDLIGGGAQNYSAFLEYMGQVKEFGGMGSPFQINYPSSAPLEYSALDMQPRNCTDNDLASRCTCIDCPDVCQTLPYIPPPGSEPTCHVGAISCLSFVLILGYGIAILAFLLGYILQLSIRRRRERKQATLDTDSFAPLSPRSHPRGLVGAGSLARSNGSRDDNTFESRDMGRGVMLLDPIENAQPRQYRLNTFLRRSFYRLGSFAASSPYLNIALILTIFGLLNVGWKNFAVETEPVRLWVGPQSESKLHKDFFDEHFGPFYRPQQVFITSANEHERTLTYDHVKYWMDAEADIRALKSQANGLTFDDVCFKPAGEGGACVVQSIGAWFGNDFSQYGRNDWADRLVNCARYPVDCLPDFQQPLSPQMVLGVVPVNDEDHKDFINAKAMVVTYVVSDSLDLEARARAMEWEETLLAYLKDLSARSVEEAGLKLSFSTGVSLEEELNKSTNMDVKIVVLSYVAMFVYVSLTLGAGSFSPGDETLSSSLRRWARNLPKLFHRHSSSATVSVDQLETPSLLPRLPTSLFTNSKVLLGFFGIALVILSVSTSVGFFSIFYVKVTLIIAEVIPFLVLAVGVDNVFILVHELDRQNALHGPNASTSSGSGSAQGANTYQTPLSPTTSVDPYAASSSTITPRGGSGDESVDAASMPTYLSAEERVARTLAKMGPSILLSTITETVAFALGALVPMPAVRNFALYAAGSVLLNAILQVTVFVSAMLIDLKRQEVSFPFLQ